MLRYVVLLVSTIVSVFFNACVFPQFKLFGVQPDMMLMVMLALLMIERTLIPVIFMTAGAIVLDILFANIIGYYSFAYVFIGLMVYFVFYRKGFPTNQHLVPMAVGAIAWFVKDLFMALFSAMLGYKFLFWKTFLATTLPGVLINGVLIFLVYQLLSYIYQKPSVRPARIWDDDIPLL